MEDGYGQKLVKDFVAHMKDELFAYNTILEIFRLRLRTFFKFVRNPHAHRKIELAPAHALALIAHSLHLLDDIQQIPRNKNASQPNPVGLSIPVGGEDSGRADLGVPWVAETNRRPRGLSTTTCYLNQARTRCARAALSHHPVIGM